MICELDQKDGSWGDIGGHLETFGDIWGLGGLGEGVAWRGNNVKSAEKSILGGLRSLIPREAKE